MSESNIMDAIRLVFGGDPACAFWRNNVGLATTDRGTKIKFGLFPGSADLIGCFRGRFIGVEIKTDSGRQSKDQHTWQACLESKGGLYFVARSEDDARAILAELHRRFPC